MLRRAGVLLVFRLPGGERAAHLQLVPGWAQAGAARTYTADNLFEYMDGNAEGYVLYNFREMHGVTCKKGDVTFVVESPIWASPISRTASSSPIATCSTRVRRRHGRADRTTPPDFRQGQILRPRSPPILKAITLPR